MAILSVTCPHCDRSVGSQLIGGRLWPADRLERGLNGTFHGVFTVGALCPACLLPIGAVVKKIGPLSIPDLNSRMNYAMTDTNDMVNIGFEIVRTWPSTPEPTIPNHLPANAHRAFKQAEDNFRLNNVEAAVSMYGRALETGLKWRFPGVSGMLDKRIKTLVASEDLPGTIGDWAHQVRLIRNEALHDPEPLEEPDMISARDFVDAVLRYVISLQVDVAVRRALPAESILPGWKPAANGDTSTSGN